LALQLLRWAVRGRPGPLSKHWGFDRGTPIDRWYIDRFLEEHEADIKGDVLEVGDTRYTDRWGSGVRSSHVLDATPQAGRETIVADLEQPSTVPAGRYDCVIVTQVLQYIFDLDAAVEALHRALRPGGVCLVTVPVISRLDTSAPYKEYWRLTGDSARRLFERRFAPDALDVAMHGNLRGSLLFLLGVASDEVSPAQLRDDLPAFPLIVTVRAVKHA
jgi:SAM-dependent methyltransferase